jgi:Sulfotransferase family
VTDASDAPVLLGGIAGTGKTRLGSLLGRHSRLSVTRKTYLWREVYARHGDLTDPDNLARCLAAALAIPGVRALHLDPDEVAGRVRERPPSYANVFDVIHGLHAEAVGKARWCDQLGLAEAYAEPVFAAFPSARFIHMVADPRRAQPEARTPGVTGWAVGKWSTSVELATRNARRFGARYLVVRHEDLLDDEHGTVGAVCSFLGEEVEPDMLDALAAPPSTVPTRGRDRFIRATVGAAMADRGYEADPSAQPWSWRKDLVEWPANRLALMAWRRLGTRAISRQVGACA